MTNEEKLKKPEKPCNICSSEEWWLRKVYGKPEWICGVCHPNPNKEGER